MPEHTVETLGGGFFAAVSKEHRFGTDAFLLAEFSAAKHRDRVADLCSGCGIVGLLLLRDFQPASVTAVELLEDAHSLALISKDLSGAENFFPLNADLRQWRSPEPLDLIICNPPYKADGAGLKSSGAAAALARHEIECTLGDVCAAAKRNLKYGGRLCLCNRPERLADCISAMRENGIEPKRLQTVHKNASSGAWLILVEGRLAKSSASFMKIEPPLIVGSGRSYAAEHLKGAENDAKNPPNDA